MEYIIKDYKPAELFHFFEKISLIPRGSGNEKEISDYLVSFARERGLEYIVDDLYNVIIKKDGTFGGENAPVVMLQGHTDMVCEKNADKVHDFEKDPIELVVKDGMLWANGTTLGADDGIAVAIMLAILDSHTLTHPPLECVFTSQEEIGLFGAAALDTSVLKADIMINLYSEEEGIATVSCAGGMRYSMIKESTPFPLEHPYILSFMVKGLFGGHSGKDINIGRGNANKITGRILYHMMQIPGMELIRINGGDKENAIPREAEAAVAFRTIEARTEALRLLEQLEEAILGEIGYVEDVFEISSQTSEQQSVVVLAKEDADKIIEFLYLAPNGVIETNVKQDNFVVASINMGVVRTEGSTVTVRFSPRSSVASIQEETKMKLRLLGDLLGFTCEIAGEYPGWSYEEESRIRTVFCDSFRNLYGRDLKVEAIHAGLECGLFIGKMPKLDAIAVGPNCYDCHTPGEHIDLASCERTWDLLCDVLKNLI